MNKDMRLIVVSNRLPMRLSLDEEGNREIIPSPGGLVTALNPVLHRNRGMWIGWVGDETEEGFQQELDKASEGLPYEQISVPLSKEEEDTYYRGFSNETLWPLFHDLLGYCKFDPATWEEYQRINERFADYVAGHVEPNDVIWVHDYQLILVGHYLRKKGVKNPLLFFLHIPFPSPDLYRRLPWRKELIDALLKYDTVGFHTKRDHENFVATVSQMNPEAGTHSVGSVTTIFHDNCKTRAGNWAISIDYDEFRNAACTKDVEVEAWLFHEHFAQRSIILGVDRLDYTKGIPERMLAFERFLEKYPEMHEKVSLFQLVVPSRTHVPDYQDLKHTIDALVGRINGRFSKAGWVPLHYVYRSLKRTELLGRYHACEVALITPLRDGMNLVAKEYCAACIGDHGVLILSEFAGAAEELGEHVLLVNPFDIDRTADAIHEALTMPQEERLRRMSALRGIIHERDVHSWVRSIFEAAGLRYD
ncbi:MAG: trehalose 6-phosphate synthase/phosphatase [Candidatus Sumerlaeota bacterium]|nr:trehalose 6-phosphate synthase/phosphatase [Candidatus Sumerlaeota bacterium]